MNRRERMFDLRSGGWLVLLAIARTVGWVAHWLEQCENPTPIGRPRQVYTGETERQYTPLSER